MKKKVAEGIYQLGPRKFQIRVKCNGEESRRVFNGSLPQAKAVRNEIKKRLEDRKADNQVWAGFADIEKEAQVKTLGDVASEYLTSLAGSKHSTIQSFRGSYSRCIKHFADLNIKKIDYKKLTEIRAWLLERRTKTGSPLSNTTVNIHMKYIRLLLGYAHKLGYIENVPIMRALPSEPAQVDPFEPEELEEILNEVPDHLRPVFRLLAATGMRPSEAYGLKWAKVDWQRGEIVIDNARVVGHEGLPKTPSSIRTIPMLPAARSALEDLREKTVRNMHDYVVVHKSGAPVDTVSRQWNKAVKAAGVRHREMYQLRHTFASTLLQEGVDVGWISKVLGHSNLQTTFKYYLRYIPSADSANLKLASKVFAGGGQTTPKGVKTS